MAGCPQCGTLLYPGDSLYSEAVHHGLNADDGDYRDDMYVRCKRCGFICNMERDRYSHPGAKDGWGITQRTMDRTTGDYT